MYSHIYVLFLSLPKLGDYMYTYLTATRFIYQRYQRQGNKYRYVHIYVRVHGCMYTCVYLSGNGDK